MDVNLINPILDSFSETLPQIGFQSVERKNLSIVNNVLKNTGVIVNIALIGQIKGVILIGMSIDSAKNFASKMMMGMEVLEFDDMAQSAVSEMSNMVCAGACTRFYSMNIKGLDISPPTLIVGTGVDIKLPVPSVIDIQFMADDIPVNLYVGLIAS
jgi:chemotaxis protein CheX